jgi:hypothetical protein
MATQYESTKVELDKAIAEKAYKQAQGKKMEAFLAEMKRVDNFLPEWSDDVWRLMVESGTVNRDGTITFKFTSGREITI